MASPSDKVMSADALPMMVVERLALTLPAKRDLGGYCPPEELSTVARLRRAVVRRAQCSGDCLKEVVTRRIPILDWLPRYNFKENILGDVIAGITVALIHIPQGMGFALLANIPAICGIYMAFFPVIAYALLATSHHNSMGTFAVITLMTGKVVNQYATFPDVGGGAVAGNSSADALDVLATGDPTYTPIEVATIVCFMVGLWSVLLGFLSMGSLTVFFNDMLVSGFSTGAAVHVVTSQVKDLLGINVQAFSGPLKIIYSYIDIFNKITTANYATLIISAISITVLSLNNELLKPRLAKITKIPMPIELIVVIIGTTACYLANFVDLGVKIVGDIPTGIPSPAVPPLSLASAVAVDSLVIAIIAFAGSFSLARIFAIKHDYEVDANQELYAMGIGNIFSSFFSCAPMASAIARVLIQDAVGGVTQLACLVTAFVIFWVLLFIGPVFEFLPKACLASIIVVALKGMFMQFFDMMRMWKVSRVDAMLWMVTFLAVVIIDVDWGLLFGVVVAISVLVVRGQNPEMTKLGKVPNSDLYLESKLYGQACDLPAMVVVRIRGALHFANRDNFRESLNKASGLDPLALKKASLAAKKAGRTEDVIKKVRHLLLDCQGLSACDASGSKLITRLNSMYDAVGITLCFAGLNEDVLRSFEVMGTLEAITEHRIFHTVHDAVSVLKRDDSNVMRVEMDVFSTRM